MFLNDANLLGILKKGYTKIHDLKNEIKILGRSLNREDLEEEFKNTDLFNINHEEQPTQQEQTQPQQDGNDLLAGQTSPISSFLQEAKKRKQRMDKPVDNFHLENVNKPSEEDKNAVMMQCDFGASPKVEPVSRRKR